MRNRWFVLALLGLGIGLSSPDTGSIRADDDADRIAKLVKQLGSSRFAERDRAKRDLEAIGTPALDALRAAARSKDLETSRRAVELVKRMEEKIALDSLLAPKRVRLNLKDTPVTQAVAELAKQSGYSVHIQGDQTALAKRKITLDTGDTTFWQALDQLCAKAGLVENNNAYNPYNGGPYGQPIRMQPVMPGQLQPVPLPPAARPGVQLRQLQQGGAVQFQLEVKVEAVQVAPPAQAQPAPVQKVAPPIPARGQAAPAQPAPLQVRPAVQVQPFLAPPMQIRGGVVIHPAGSQPFNPNQITLVGGKPQEVPTCYSGAVRVRAVTPAAMQPGVPVRPAAKREGEAVVVLQVSPEPRLQNFQLMGDVQLDKAIDDQGQKLSVPMDPMPVANPGVIGRGGFAGRTAYYNPYNAVGRYAQVRLKLGEKQAKKLKELSGHLSAQMLSPLEPVLTVENVLKSGGKKVEGKGGTLAVQSVEKQADGTYKVRFHLELAPGFIQAPFQGPVAPVQAMPVNGPGGVQVAPGGQVQRIRIVRPMLYNTHGLPTLMDAKGRSYQLTQNPQRTYRANFGGGQSVDVTMVFRAHESQGEPAQLVLHGQRNISVQIPFRLENVTLEIPFRQETLP